MKAMKFIALLLLAGSLLPAQALRKAPSFTLPDSGRVFHDLTDYRGKVVIIELMRTDCSHCKAFSSVLEEINKKYAGRVQIFGMVNPPDTLDSILAYQAATKITFPILFDSGQAAFTYVRTGSVSLPRVFIIDRNGMLRDDVSYDAKNTAFFEKRGIFTNLEKALAIK